MFNWYLKQSHLSQVSRQIHKLSSSSSWLRAIRHPEHRPLSSTSSCKNSDSNPTVSQLCLHFLGSFYFFVTVYFPFFFLASSFPCLCCSVLPLYLSNGFTSFTFLASAVACCLSFNSCGTNSSVISLVSSFTAFRRCDLNVCFLGVTCNFTKNFWWWFDRCCRDYTGC